MRIVTIAALSALTAAAAPAQVPPVAPSGPVTRPPDDCRIADKASAPAVAAGPQRLSDLPPAYAIRTVYRTDDRGCPILVVASGPVGVNPDKAMPLDGKPQVRALD